MSREREYTTRSKRQSKWWRFSVRTLLVGVGICGVVLAVWVAYLEPFRREQRLLSELGVSGEDFYVRTELHGPWWLQRFADGKYAQRVFEIQGNTLNDDDLAKLHGLPHLTDVTLVEANAVSDEGIRCLAELPSLRWLALHDISITNAGLAHLHGQADLESLFIGSDKITDEGLRHIGTLTGLRELALKCPITDEGLRHIGNLTELRVLRLCCRVTDDGMEHLESLANLETLVCTADPVPNEIVAKLQRETNFDYLETPLSDVLEDIALRHSVDSYRLDEEGLAGAGISASTPITFEKLDVPSGDALRAILEPLGLDWCWEGNGIVVTDQRTAENSRPGITKLKQMLPKLAAIETDWYASNFD